MQRKTTKEILAESFKELAEKKPINKITIADITGNCGMTPPTFYRYYKDKYDMISWIYMTGLQKITEQIGCDGYGWQDAVRDIGRFRVENRSYALNAIKHTRGRDAFAGTMGQIHAEALTNVVQKSFPGKELPLDIVTMIKVFSYGVCRLSIEWLLDPPPLTPEKCAELSANCMPEGLKPYLDPNAAAAHYNPPKM